MSRGSRRVDWLSVRESGTLRGLRFLAFTLTYVGRAPARFMLYFVSLYYLLRHGVARRASRDFLTRAGHPAGWLWQWRHITRFAHAALDRVAFVSGHASRFDITRTGSHHLDALHEQQRGALLIGAHLGSFEAMSASGRAERPQPLNVVVNEANAKRMGELLSSLDPQRSAHFISLEGSPVVAALEIRDRIEAGELVALLADRIGDENDTVTVDFFGAPARFPKGPFALAAALKCPVYLTFGLYRGGRRYDLFCEPFADPLRLERKDRAGAIARVVARYAERLEEYARREPLNWFNFYDFWEGGEASRSAQESLAASSSASRAVPRASSLPAHASREEHPA